MNERLKKALESRLKTALKFVTSGAKTPYKYTNLSTKEEVEVKTLLELPCEFMLLVNDKELANKQKNSLRDELNDFLKSCNNSFEYFTGDHLHPVPNNTAFDKEAYNPTLGYYGMKRNQAFWTKKSGEVRVMYLKHLLAELTK